MRYMLLIYSPESIMADMNPTEQEGYMNEWFAYTDAIQATGKMLAEIIEEAASRKASRSAKRSPNGSRSHARGKTTTASRKTARRRHT